ncbi:MAG TPA: hypothetical protein VM287_05900, partial [Egibacteraceae bacterium]|nr:hypothetical protein [Egibacteraceae bacterium]
MLTTKRHTDRGGRALLLGVALAALAATVAGASSVQAHRPASSAPTALAGAGDPLAGLAPVVAAALAPPEYHLAPGAGGWRADNPRQGLAVGFSAHGLSVA